MEPPTLAAYHGLRPFFGDLHNHCGISYGHGTIEEAFQNARERLDFCSVTGHAFWPDMPAPATPDLRYAVAYHTEGFDRLRRGWDHVQEATEASHVDGAFVTFLGFEMHSSADGDYTVLYNGARGDILYSSGLAELGERIRALRKRGVGVIAFPHHIAYKRGRRGVNWDTFDSDLSRVVEIVSMHGASETDDGPRPYLHTMGPSDHQSTLQNGLALGHVFGVVGSTDHHSAHPGSYGHGLTGLWAKELSREAIFDALLARRTYALTGDRVQLAFALNGLPMGAQVAPCEKRRIEIAVRAGAAIDYVDLVRNNRLIRRWSACDVPQHEPGEVVRTRLFLEVGWAHRGRALPWDVTLGVSDGEILSVEPRFRGAEVVAPNEKRDDAPAPNYFSHCRRTGEREVRFQTVTFGNPTNTTCATQGVCLDVAMPADASVRAAINGREVAIPLRRLLAGAAAGYVDANERPAWRFHRAPLAWECDWSLTHEEKRPADRRDVYYVRVRQTNDQWAWSSPVFVG